MSTTILERTDLAHSFSPARSLPLLLTSDPVMTGASRLFAGPGLTRIAPGTYVPSQEWAEARPDLRHMTLIRAAMAKTRGAVWLGLPLVGRLPGRVQCLRLSEARARTALLQRHRRPGLGDLLNTSGAHTSSVADTVVDLARWGGLTQGVCAMDAALAAHLCTRAELTDAVDHLATGARGIRSARTAVHLTDARSESPGESLSRVRMWQATLPHPDLQHEVHIDDHTYRLDFLWPRTKVVGEFDGHIKYRKNSFGKDAEDTVLNERRRELALTRAGYDVARWTWEEAWPTDAPAMLRELARHGIHPTGVRW